MSAFAPLVDLLIACATALGAVKLIGGRKSNDHGGCLIVELDVQILFCLSTPSNRMPTCERHSVKGIQKHPMNAFQSVLAMRNGSRIRASSRFVWYLRYALEPDQCIVELIERVGCCNRTAFWQAESDATARHSVSLDHNQLTGITHGGLDPHCNLPCTTKRVKAEQITSSSRTARPLPSPRPSRPATARQA